MNDSPGFSNGSTRTAAKPSVSTSCNKVMCPDGGSIALNETGVTLDPTEMEKIFASVGKNKTGSINYTEFLTAAMDLTSVITSSSLETAFNYFDQDGNGYIDRQEILNAIGQGWIDDTQLSDLFKAVDINKDGQVSGQGIVRSL